MSYENKSFLLVEIVHNGSPVATEDVILDLKTNYHIVQVRPKRLAAASEGGETWVTVFVNSPVAEFLTLNIAWDLIKFGAKKLFLKPLLTAFDKLSSQPGEPIIGLRLLKLKLQFDDTAIIIGGINGNFYSIVGTIFQKLSILMERFKTEEGLEVTRIELPVEYRESYDDKYQLDIFHDRVDTAFYLTKWKIVYYDGVINKVYDFKSDKLFDY